MNNKVLERMMVCRIALLMKTPFWGNMVTRLPLVEVNDKKELSTAATDGRKIYYYPGFIGESPTGGLSDKQIVFVLCHEILHVVYDHISRGHGHDKMISNIAADFACNSTLKEENIGEFIGKAYDKNALINTPKEERTMGTLYDARYIGWAYEAIYEDLIKDVDSIKKGMGYGDISFDKHIDSSNLSEDEKQQIRDSIREAVLSAAQNVKPGDVPASIRRMISGLIAPKMNWKQLLDQYIQSQLRADTTYLRLGKRSFSGNVIFPSQKRQPRVKVTLVLDMSGSIGPEEIRVFFSEITGIITTHASFEIGIICFDTEAYNYKVYTEDDIDDILDYEPVGGGGTDLSCVVEYFREIDFVPAQMVVFTDGEIYNWGDPDYCPTMFIIKNNHEIIAPFGDSLMY